ncbi:MAG: hypothetical protein ACE5H4_08240 [Candidatus Thorarchaeota archaeon]
MNQPDIGRKQEAISPAGTDISEITPHRGEVTVKFMVLSVEEPRRVVSRKWRTNHLVAEAVIGDPSGKITLILWNHDVEAVQVGKTYLLRKGRVIVYDECMQLTVGRQGEIVELDESIDNIDDSVDMSKPFMGQSPRRKRPRSKTGRSFRGDPGREGKGYCTWKSF